MFLLKSRRLALIINWVARITKVVNVIKRFWRKTRFPKNLEFFIKFVQCQMGTKKQNNAILKQKLTIKLSGIY